MSKLYPNMKPKPPMYQQPKPYYFKDLTHQQVAEVVDEKYPINLKLNQDLVDRVYMRYPLIDKAQVGLIIRMIFSTIRELLILGKVINFTNLFHDLHLNIFPIPRGDKLYPSVKIKLFTPKILRD
jgi:hypothetical protein